MALKQQMKQSMGMTMTPQLQQAIKILQMSVIELQQEIGNALIENPCLEEATGDEGPDEHKEAAQVSVEDGNEFDAKASTSDGASEFDFGALSGEDRFYRSTRNTSLDEIPSYEQVLSRPQTLYDHLIWQWRLSTSTPEQTNVAEELIGNFNEDGYFVATAEEIAEQLKVDVAEVNAVLFRIQRFDPPGVGARNLQECLLIQAEILGEDEEVEQIIENHLPELETKNYASISKKTGLPLHRVVELCKVIHNMEPKPGRSYHTSEPQYFVPDVYVVKVGGKFMVILNEDGLPRLKVSTDYKEQLDTGMLKEESKTFVREKLRGATWLLKSIYQRQRTIFRVTESILQRQKDFFDKGPEHLHPMILKDVADELSLHESTISRVTTNKFVHTPHGIFELKYFFNSGIKRSDGGDDLASASVKQKIKDIIGREDPKRPLSDQEIVEMLKADKIEIARRTVAKYREALAILPSSKRKKFF
jgi:RNA polymerase sigma-54 factor